MTAGERIRSLTVLPTYYPTCSPLSLLNAYTHNNIDDWSAKHSSPQSKAPVLSSHLNKLLNTSNTTQQREKSEYSFAMDTDLKVEKQHNLGSRQAKALVWLKDIIAEAQTFEIGSKGPIKYSSIDQTPYPPCEEPSAHLSCIAITNLKGDSHHLNSYIVLRCLTPPTRMAAIVAVMEDEFSNDIVLEMFHQDDGFSIKPTDVINIGAIILVKEPFCKITPWGQRIIRVDHITDVEFVLSDDPRVPPNWKECMVEEQEALSFYTNQGFEAFKKKEYWQAIKK